MTRLLPSTSSPLFGRTITGRTICLTLAPFMKINTITPTIIELFHYFDLIDFVFNRPGPPRIRFGACNGPASMRVRVRSEFYVVTVSHHGPSHSFFLLLLCDNLYQDGTRDLVIGYSLLDIGYSEPFHHSLCHCCCPLPTPHSPLPIHHFLNHT